LYNNDIPAGLIVDDSDIEKIKDEIRTNGDLSILNSWRGLDE